MIVEIAYRPPLRRWHLTLAEALEAAGHATRLVAAPGGSRSLSAMLAMAVDRRLFRKGASLFDVVSERRSGDAGASRADLVVALDGEHREADAAVLTPLFAGVAGDRGLLEMITGDAVPIVRIVDRDKGDVAIGRPKIDDRRSLSRATEQILARVISLVLQAVRRVEQGRAVPDVQPLDATAVSARVGPWTHIGRAVGRTVAARLSGASGGPAHWRIACRIDADGAQSGPDRVGDGGFVTLPQGHDRFWADPMPFVHDGRLHVFFEDFPYATAKGVIAHVEIDDRGAVSAPKLVLEQPGHLSYPFVCEHGGAIYMLPESGAARRLQLFRADPFPDRWRPDRILLDDIALGDATPVRHDGQWWLFATSAGDGGSSSDQLCLFHAPDLLGPWRPHADNPVLIDAGAARPAGAMWHENGRLMRIAQDCRGGYGDGLVVCRVDRLDPAGYAQTVLERIGPPAGLGADGIHTYNRAGRYELIDLRSPCVRRARGLAGRGARRPAAPRAPERD